MTEQILLFWLLWALTSFLIQLLFGWFSFHSPSKCGQPSSVFTLQLSCGIQQAAHSVRFARIKHAPCRTGNGSLVRIKFVHVRVPRLYHAKAPNSVSCWLGPPLPQLCRELGYGANCQNVRNRTAWWQMQTITSSTLTMGDEWFNRWPWLIRLWNVTYYYMFYMIIILKEMGLIY